MQGDGGTDEPIRAKAVLRLLAQEVDVAALDSSCDVALISFVLRNEIAMHVPKGSDGSNILDWIRIL